MMTTLTIDSLNTQGQGVGRDRAGWVWFVDGALPGETVAVEVVRTASHYKTARVVRRYVDSPDRVVPRCPIADHCGGCTLQTLAYDAQVEVKARIVRDALERIGGVDLDHVEMETLVPMATPWAYRNKAIYPITMAGDTLQMGFYEARSHQVVAHDRCPIHMDTINTLKAALTTCLNDANVRAYDDTTKTGTLRHVMVRASERTETSLVACMMTEADSSLDRCVSSVGATSGYQLIVSDVSNSLLKGTWHHVSGARTIQERLRNVTYSVMPTAFFQVNTTQAEALCTCVTSWAQASGARHALDLYTGVGTLALQLAAIGMTVTGVETVQDAVHMARHNAHSNGLTATFIAADVNRYVRETALDKGVDLVVVDPPRKGLEQEGIQALKDAASVRTLVYVSCNPATLARDIRSLSSVYTVRKIQPFDLFPHTMHVETVCLMTRVR